VVLWLVVGGGWLVGEVDVDGLLGAAFLLLGEVGQGLFVDKARTANDWFRTLPRVRRPDA
jgi:hypothetical protein